MVLRLLLFTLVIAIALIACVSCAVDPVIRAPLTCENDVIDKFAKDDRLPIPKNNISLVPLELQLNALEFLNDRKVMQAPSFRRIQARSGPFSSAPQSLMHKCREHKMRGVRPFGARQRPRAKGR
ncbi:MAG: hypothetical protein R3C60_04265 [Parvularculaceae bacterium]